MSSSAYISYLPTPTFLIGSSITSLQGLRGKVCFLEASMQAWDQTLALLFAPCVAEQVV